MSQGPRRGWVRALFAGLGVVICTGLVGCMNTDKDKLPPKIGTNTKQPGPGLPNTVRLPGQPGSGGVGASGQPNYNGVQPAGGIGSAAGRKPGMTNYNTTGLGAGGVGTAGGVVPSMNPGAGMGSGSSNFGAMPPPNNLTPINATDRGGYSPTYNPPATGFGADPGIIPPNPPGVPSNFEVLPPNRQ